MKMRKIAAMGLSAVMAASMVPALPVMADDASGKVYYLNFKPEQDEAWQNLAAKYTEETGVPVTVVTAASGQYETTLQSEMAKSDAPTLFQVNGCLLYTSVPEADSAFLLMRWHSFYPRNSELPWRQLEGEEEL